MVQRHLVGRAWRTQEGLRTVAYINFGAIPKRASTTRRRPSRSNIDIDEGKLSTSRASSFQGTASLAKGYRRELMLEEGQVYNSQLWEYSLLRLNQLEYF